MKQTDVKDAILRCQFCIESVWRWHGYYWQCTQCGNRDHDGQGLDPVLLELCGVRRNAPPDVDKPWGRDEKEAR